MSVMLDRTAERFTLTLPSVNHPRSQHGTVRGYRLGCRCWPCTDAQVSNMREQRRRVKADGYDARRVRGVLTRTERREKVVKLRADGLKVYQIAKVLGTTSRTIKTDLEEIRDSNIGPLRPEQIPAPIPYDKLSPKAQAMVADTPEGFISFCNEFWPEEPVPAHIERFVRACWDDERARWKKRVVVVAPPNHSKSSFFTVRWSIWRVAQNRDWQILVVSATGKNAQEWSEQMAKELEENEPLIATYGGFHTDAREVRWRPGGVGGFRVAGSKITRGYNILSLGLGSQIKSKRCNEVVCDDIVTTECADSEDARRDVSRLYRKDIVSRPGPGGIIRVVGCREHMHDLYGELEETNLGGKPVYEFINFPAVESHERRRVLWDCTQEGREHGENYPECCRNYDYLMGPEVLGSIGSRMFEQNYQGNPVPEEARLALPEWIEACKDRWRRRGEAPEQPENFVRCLLLDPSGGREKGSLLTADLDVSDPEVFRISVARVLHEPMTVRGTWAAMEQACVDSRAAGRPIRHFAVETNMALWAKQDDPEYRAWRNRWSIRQHLIVTGSSNSLRQKQVADALGADFEFSRIRIPWGDPETIEEMTSLVTEALEFPMGRSWDVLMTLQFAKGIVRELHWEWLAARQVADRKPTAGWDRPKRLGPGWHERVQPVRSKAMEMARKARQG